MTISSLRALALMVCLGSLALPACAAPGPIYEATAAAAAADNSAPEPASLALLGAGLLALAAFHSRKR